MTVEWTSSRTSLPSARWKALGTYAFLATGDPTVLDAARVLARQVLDAVDRSCSRFRDDSDLTRANARPGHWVPVDPLLVAAVGVAVESARETDGLVDPLLGRPMAWLGYDADFEVVRRVNDPTPATPPPTPRPGAWREIGIDPESAILVPAGCSLDLGATAKAWASDLVAAAVVERFGCEVMVSLGGDVRMDGPDGSAPSTWPVAVTEHPEGADPEVVWLEGGGLATSSTTRRRWARHGQVRHHLLDPRTGLPTSGPWRTVTATGATSVAANTATTAALVLGDDAEGWLIRKSVTGRLVSHEGRVHTIGGWPAEPDARTSITDRRPR